MIVIYYAHYKSKDNYNLVTQLKQENEDLRDKIEGWKIKWNDWRKHIKMKKQLMEANKEKDKAIAEIKELRKRIILLRQK